MLKPVGKNFCSDFCEHISEYPRLLGVFVEVGGGWVKIPPPTETENSRASSMCPNFNYNCFFFFVFFIRNNLKIGL